MKRDYAEQIVRQLVLYSDYGCKRRARSGFYVRQTIFPRATNEESARVGGNAATYNAKTRKVWVRLDALKSTQSCLGRPRLIYQLRRFPLKTLPTVFALGRGKYLIFDGHHRATAAALLGKRRIKCQEARK